MALFLQVIMDRTCRGREVGWRELMSSFGLAMKSPSDPGQSTEILLGRQISKQDVVVVKSMDSGAKCLASVLVLVTK